GIGIVDLEVAAAGSLRQLGNTVRHGARMPLFQHAAGGEEERELPGRRLRRRLVRAQKDHRALVRLAVEVDLAAGRDHRVLSRDVAPGRTRRALRRTGPLETGELPEARVRDAGEVVLAVGRELTVLVPVGLRRARLDEVTMPEPDGEVDENLQIAPRFARRIDQLVDELIAPLRLP